MVHAADPRVSILLVKHPAIKAVGFTGSERAGRAIFDAAAQRPEPIPAYVEMGSNNPIFLLPGALDDSTDTIVQGLFASINAGVGQMCTSPGVVLGDASEKFAAFGKKLGALFENGAPGTMLHPSIMKGYNANVEQRAKAEGLSVVQSGQNPDPNKTEAVPVMFETTADVWLRNKELEAEIFGPSTVLVRAKSKAELLRAAEEWNGTLTASVFGTEKDLKENRDLIAILQNKAGRVIFNGFPTGVEVSPAMHHGGPYPATADPKFTSVGTAAILRFVRPVCYQNFPAAVLPAELQNENPRQIWRTLNGEFTKAAVASGK
jgi:NADP-dependent aldehyde dehydrogenase